MKVNKLLNQINEMGRSRQEMKDLVQALGDTLEEHLWKIFAYHKVRQQDMNGWLNSLNKHLPKLRLFNIKLGSKNKINLDKESLYQELVTKPFEGERDIRVRISQWHNEGYPIVYLTEDDILKLQNLAKKYVDCIFENDTKFTVSRDELL